MLRAGSRIQIQRFELPLLEREGNGRETGETGEKVDFLNNNNNSIEWLIEGKKSEIGTDQIERGTSDRADPSPLLALIPPNAGRESPGQSEP
jgi:hypothetical protein